jgi:hypothetical protein
MAYMIRANGNIEPCGPDDVPQNGEQKAVSEDDPIYLAALAAHQTTTDTVLQQAQAQALLDKSDVVLLRAQEDGLAFPTEWKTYRSALRTIVKSGGTLPPLPSAFPDGSAVPTN